MSKKQYYIRTFGCQMNDLDSIQMGRTLESEGYELSQNSEDADLILINTCSVRDKPAQKLYSDIGRYRHLKEKNPQLILGVTGCQAKVDGEALLKRFSYLDLILGPDQGPEIASYLEKLKTAKKNRLSDVVSLSREDYRFIDLRADQVSDSFRAYVNIMKGCDNFCSFCIVPFTRGREVSRSSDDILKEVKTLCAAGVQEITLLGQNVNSYGNKRSNEISFAALLDRIASETSVRRLKFTTSHPKDLSHELIDSFAHNPILAPQMHLPVQSGSDKILEKMYRGYTLSEYEEKLSHLTEACPEIGLSTDIIVGFPGETEDDFQATLDFIQKIKYDAIYAFHYSPRPKTTASKFFSDDVSLADKKSRLNNLLSIQAEINYKKNKDRLQQEELVLMESFSKLGTTLQGRTAHNRIMHVLGDDSMIGKFYKVKVTTASPHCLGGELIDNKELYAN